jgi:hypothetical protein
MSTHSYLKANKYCYFKKTFTISCKNGVAWS